VEVLEASGTAQPQGSCTYTEPAALTTFANFSGTYSASTYVTLTDERDNKNYPVVKIGDRWWMARNLNYQGTTQGANQFNLTWQDNSKQPSIASGSGSATIGHFWCPGGYSSSTVSSTRASCDVWGALYVWETAMMLDGKWTSSAHSNSGWSERTGYGTSTTSTNTQNHGQSDGGATTGGRGICPVNWHVPTDGEWGDVLNAMETGAKVHNTSAGWIGTGASRGMSACSAPSGITSGNTYVNDTQTNWYYSAQVSGTDNYKFRVLPAGRRYANGSDFNLRGSYAQFWTSSAYNASNAWKREFNYNTNAVQHVADTRSYSHTIRCIRNL
jgi:uncharacterized protein (TIGR02145 family)